DPMLGKLIVSGETRRQAIERLSRALSEYEVVGVQTSLPFFRALVSDADFLEGRFDTGWLDRRLASGSRFLPGTAPEEWDEEQAVFAAAVLAREEEKRFA